MVKNEENQSNDKFIGAMEAEINNRYYIVSSIVMIAIYAGLTYWLNAIRADAAIWLVWALIIVQFYLYFKIFLKSYTRSTELGLNNNLALILTVVLAVLGRVNDWQIIVIPAMVVVVSVASTMDSAKKHKS